MLVLMNSEWALGELRQFLALLAYRDGPGLYAATYVGTDDEITAQKAVVERIWTKVIGSNSGSPVVPNDRYRRDREWAITCLETIKRDAEIRENLGEDAPDLNAGKMHAWVWEGAQSLWASGHFSEAVEGAAKKLNAETQNKVGRRDVSETDLFNQSFGDDTPQADRPRLRLPDDDDGKTSKSIRRGIRAFAEGSFAAIRNPAAHDGTELSETEALEQLAALSILARWVDRAERRR